MTDQFHFVTEPLAGGQQEIGDALVVLKQVFGDEHFNEDYWKWKYAMNPFGKSVLINARAVSQDDTRVAGFRAFWRWKFWYQGGITEAAQPCDTAVVADYRRRGLFTGMTKKAIDVSEDEGIKILFNNPNPESMRGYIKLGWHDLGGMRWYVRPVHTIKLLAELFRWRGQFPAHQWTKPSRSMKEKIDENKLLPLLDRCRMDHRDTHWTARSPGFYQWRYGVSPHRKYNIVFFPKEDVYKVIAVYGTARRGNLHEVQILDIMMDKHSVKVARNAVSEIIEMENPDWVTFAASRGFPLLKEMKLCGFLPLPRAANLVAKALKGSAVRSLKPEQFGIVLGDLDTF